MCAPCFEFAVVEKRALIDIFFKTLRTVEAEQVIEIS